MEKPVLWFLDRDGTLIEDPGYLGRKDNWKEEIKVFPGVIQGLSKLRETGKIVVGSNQAGVARGYFSIEIAEKVQEYIREILRGEGGVILNGWQICPFVGEDYAKKHKLRVENPWVKETDMRKPRIGMISLACLDLGLSLEDLQVYSIGDKAIDVQTGINARGKGILVLTGHGEENREKVEQMRLQYPGRIFIANNFLEAARLGLEDLAKLQ